MARDMDLVRTLLTKVADLNLPPGASIFIPYNDHWFEIEGHDRNQVVDNLRMLHDGGFVSSSGPTESDFGIAGLTWQGADFVDTTRNPEVWDKTKAAAKKAGGFGFDLLFQFAKAEAKRFAAEKLGLPL